MTTTTSTTSALTPSTICVFCGSSTGTNPLYAATARDLGVAIARRGLGLVYGGGTHGLMGAVANAAHGAGAPVVGFIPQAMTQFEGLLPVGEMHLVPDMHTRKRRMAEEAGAFIALPGGFGTLEETFEMLTWSQLGIHRKPIGILNTDGFYAPLLALIDRAVQDGFIRPEARGLLVVRDTVDELMEAVMAFEEAPAGARYGLDWTGNGAGKKVALPNLGEKGGVVDV
ncbi:hypothetical protein HDU89_005840 [Geranomyces variabilis]|nr:hypothetical protein HDU89_005840 [Geranomyces variabilis]